ncbi:MAG: ABC transporter substrate-binding protein, partial [Shimia sp.]
MKDYVFGGLCLVYLAATAAYSETCAEGQRFFAHAAGETCIPEDPQRMVALQNQNALLPLMELGVTPLGASGGTLPGGEQGFRRLDGYDSSDVLFLGMHREEDVALVASLSPDLIVTTTSPEWHFETFSKIAPTIVIDMFTQPVQVALAQIADATNRMDEHDALKARFDARVAELVDPLGDVPAQTKALVVVQFEDGKPMALPWVQGFGAAFEAVGFERTDWEEENVTGTGVHAFQPEVIGDIAADAIFVIDFTGDDGPEGQYERFLAHPLYQLHPAAQAGQVYQIDATSMGG